MGKFRTNVFNALGLLSIAVIFVTFKHDWSGKKFELLPSYVIAVRGNKLPIYTEVKGLISYFDDDFMQFTSNSTQNIWQFKREENTIKSYAPTVTEHLNYHIWVEICHPVIENLLHNPTFPHLPNAALYVDKLYLSDILKNSGIRIFGYLKVRNTANYQFVLTTKYAVSHVWLSQDKEIRNSKQIFNDSSFNQNVFSRIIRLKAETEYFIDIVIKTGNRKGLFNLKWIENDKHEVPSQIEKSSFMPFSDTLYHSYDLMSKYQLPMLKKRKDISELYRTKANYNRLQSLLIPFIDEKDVKDLFPVCNYEPSYLQKDKIKDRYQGVWETHLTYIYPPDETNISFQLDSVNRNHLIGGNPVLDEIVAEKVAYDVMEALEKQFPNKYSLISIINIELNDDPPKGSRYLVELKLSTNNGSVVRFSEYVYLPKDSSQLCYPRDFKWDKSVEVNFILTSASQERWVKYFIDSMSSIYEKTKDGNFNVIVVDFNSKNMDIASVLEKSKLPRYTFLQHIGKFHKTMAIQAAANTVLNPNAILLQVDLHVTMPSDIVEFTRKHTIQGKMACSPMLVRLQCGATPQYPFGFWENSGYGIFSVYKSDWFTFGGMNIMKYLHRWGGEDWDLLDRVLNSGYEVERIKLRNFYHVFHSKKGMWHQVK